MINIAELLKDAPKGMKLYSPLFGEVEYMQLGDENKVWVKTSCGTYYFDKYGKPYAFDKAECLLFPSKDYRTWNGWEPAVEPKFKAGDWIAGIDDEGDVSTEKIVKFLGDKVQLVDSDGCFTLYPKSELNHYRLWTIADAKDGDVIAFNDSSDVNLPLSWVGIYKQPKVISNRSYWFYCIITSDHNFRGYDSWWVSNAHPATKEQRDLLFQKMKEAGYQWDADKKELKNIPKRYDIKNFHAGIPVLVRDKDNQKWCYLLYSHYDNTYEDGICFNAGSVDWRQCIPFEGNEHLLGTTDPCGEEFINW